MTDKSEIYNVNLNVNDEEGEIYMTTTHEYLQLDLYKIGSALDSNDRAKQLSKTSIPSKFVIHRKFKTKGKLLAENLIHYSLRNRRYNEDREFFVVTPDEFDEVARIIQGIIDFVDHDLLQHLNTKTTKIIKEVKKIAQQKETHKLTIEKDTKNNRILLKDYDCKKQGIIKKCTILGEEYQPKSSADFFRYANDIIATKKKSIFDRVLRLSHYRKIGTPDKDVHINTVYVIKNTDIETDIHLGGCQNDIRVLLDAMKVTECPDDSIIVWI